MSGAEPGNSAKPCERLWRELVEIHNHCKSLFILAEETDPELLDFLQPAMEQRHALEHIMRAMACELGMLEQRNPADSEYIEQSLRKAIGHEFRAFFDAADWLQISLREKTLQMLAGYSNECITAVFPDYYHTIRPRLEQIAQQVATIRTNKDITKHETLDLIREYRKIVTELADAMSRIAAAIPALQEWTQRSRKTETERASRDTKSKVLLATFSAVLGAVLAWLIKSK